MEISESTNDRLVRAVVCGAALVGIKACPSTTGKVGSAVLAALAGWTAFSGSCPAYKALGLASN